MPIQQHFGPIQRKPRYSKEEFARRGNEIYESQYVPPSKLKIMAKLWRSLA